MPLDELRASNELLQVAFDRYINACLSIKHSLSSDQLCFQGPLGSILSNELLVLTDYKAKLRHAKTVVSQAFNLCPDVAPINKLPVETLIRIFQELVDMPGRHQCLPHIHGFPIYPLALSHVCTSWRQILHNSPSLWSRISLFPDCGVNRYTGFHLSQAKGAPLDLSIFNSSFPSDSIVYPSHEFTIPGSFTGRIRSLEARFYIPYSSSIETKKDGEDLLARCLRVNNGTLKQFALNMVFPPPPPTYSSSINHSEDPDRHILKISLPEDCLRNNLSPITDLWLRGAYFHWGSKAYHGLVSLRLDHTYSFSISDIDLLNVLKSSPRLRFLDINLEILEEDPAPAPAHLPDLEVIVGDTDLLRLIRPGSRELTVSVFDHTFEVIHDTTVKNFFSCANVVSFFSNYFLNNTAGICHLRSITPRLRSLAVTYAKLVGVLPDTAPYAPLDTLYILNDCEIQWSLLEDMINKWEIKRLVFGDKNYVIRGEEHILPVDLERELSGLSSRDIQLELVPADDERAPFKSLFFGPPPWE